MSPQISKPGAGTFGIGHFRRGPQRLEVPEAPKADEDRVTKQPPETKDDDDA
jgi:hypothetical protein